MIRYIRRFTATERLYHWAQAVPYLALMATGAAILIGKIAGGGAEGREDMRTIHLIAALGQLILPFLVVLGGRTSILFANLREAVTWRRVDFLWLAASMKRVFVRRTPLPDAGKFNPGQKINFIAVMVTLPLFALSGIVMYVDGSILIAWYAHVILFLISVPMILGHIFLAVVNPSTSPAMRGMIVGTVREEWAEHHHPAWVRQQRGGGPSCGA